MKVTVIPIVIDLLGTVTQVLEQGLDYSIFEIGENTEKSPGDLLPIKLQWKTNG